MSEREVFVKDTHRALWYEDGVLTQGDRRRAVRATEAGAVSGASACAGPQA